MQPLPWIDPLDLAARIDEPYWVLLYSGVRSDASGPISYLACRLAERIEGEDFSEFEGKLGAGGVPFENAWFGYLGYGLKNSLETLPEDLPHAPHLPNLLMMRFHRIYVFDHDAKRLSLWTDEEAPALPPERAPADMPPVQVRDLASNMSRDEYLEKAASVILHIHAGDLYQANLTRKFSGRFTHRPDGFALFKRLAAVSPAAYSAFLHLGENCVLSSSPELFLQIGGQRIRTRPIKGTAPRFDDPARDRQSREALRTSVKDRAENLMIVDLMRNDLSKSCEPGSVETEALFEITSHATIHHLSSSVTGCKRAACPALDVVKGCFPPGSMTGAPKIRAMQLCTQLERQARGVYGGAIGWFGGDGSAALSVVIRTIILHGKSFEFQVGGGIVADSTPEQELEELIDKSKGIMISLGISRAQIEQL